MRWSVERARKASSPDEAPELAGEFEAALVLGAGRFDRAGAEGLAEAFGLLVIHAVLVLVEVADFSIKSVPLLGGQPSEG